MGYANFLYIEKTKKENYGNLHRIKIIEKVFSNESN
jgi:hypothetical protein